MTVDLFGHYGRIGNKYMGSNVNGGYYALINSRSSLLSRPNNDTFIVKKDKSKLYTGIGIAAALATVIGGLLFFKSSPQKMEAAKKTLKNALKGAGEKTTETAATKNTKPGIFKRIGGFFGKMFKHSDKTVNVNGTTVVAPPDTTAKPGVFKRIGGFFGKMFKHSDKTVNVNGTTVVAPPDTTAKPGVFKRIGGFFSKPFHRKPKPEPTKPPKINLSEIFNGKPKAKTEQKVGFFRRLFGLKPSPSTVTSDVFIRT